MAFFRKLMKETLTQMKKCSVIIPLYRGKQYIEECIKSLSVQTYSDFEVILMDDGSPDDTYDFVAEILKSYSSLDARLYRQENSGVARTRNKCVCQKKIGWCLKRHKKQLLNLKFSTWFKKCEKQNVLIQSLTK